MSKPEIRSATADDLNAITAIYAHAVAHGTASYELEPPSPDEMARRFRALEEEGYPFLVAGIGAEVVGYAYAGAFRPRKAYRFAVEDSIYLAPEWQSRGIGRHLLARLIEECQTMGFRQLIAVIGDGSGQGAASVRLHAALGFSHSGTLAGSGYKFGRWLDTVFMQLEMNGGATTPPDPDSVPERRFREGT